MIAFRYFAAVIFVVMGSLVCWFNGKVAFRMKKEVESFHKICMNKAIANVLIGLAFLIWCAPSAFLGEFWE
ncbi:unnamed protein product [Caenorhabditis angaria]|uniref:7TM GPCR serpentine receptor class x (Srx) domain-containing protein n=1 Tax=Caenorhabditis angaria TaxID=860376 RepID=A0A9P1IZ13_9PELO|nr:unnamed protein product [Caenorhabditis angaria]